MTTPLASRVVSLASVAALGGCFLSGSYGPERENTAFTSATLLPSNRVVFSFKYVTYRPAQGMAAFPDGGIPKYTRDETMLGVFNVATGEMHVLAREKNKQWTNGQGHYFVSQSSDPLVLVGRSGQTRDLNGMLDQIFLLNIDDGATQPLKFKEVLAAKGQKSQIPYLVSPAGHIVFVTSAESNARNEEDGQIWLRAPDDSYHLVTDGRHYEGVEDGEIIYWVLATREFKAYNMTTYETRSLPGYRQRGYVDVTEGVLVPMTGEKIDLGHKVNGAWVYTTLPITKDAVKKARVSK